MKKLNAIYLAALALAIPAGSALAQNAPDNNQPPPGVPANPPSRRQMMLDDIKQQFHMPDSDFAPIQAMVQKIMQLQNDASFRAMRGFGPGGPGGPGGPPGGGFGGLGGPGGGGPGGPGGPGGGFGGPGGPGGPGGFGPPPQQDQSPSEVQQKADKLREVMSNPDSSPAEIKTALDDLRDTKVRAQDNLAKARQSLIQVLTSRQEATLVTMGILD